MTSKPLLSFALLRPLIIALALPVLVATSGCVLVAAGAAGAGVAWVRGALKTTVSYDMAKTYKASARAVQQLGFAKISEEKSALDAVLISRTAADKKVEIRLRSIGDKLTELETRVGLFGDEALSLAILEKIKANL